MSEFLLAPQNFPFAVALAIMALLAFPALFVGGNLVTGLFADRWMIRLGPEDLAAMLELPGGGPFEPMAGRPRMLPPTK